MHDIMHYIRELDIDGDRMNIDRLQREAGEQGLTLTSEHFEVIRYIQTRSSTEKGLINARKLANDLATRFAQQGGRRYLFRLFPKGPVTQACHIAGLEPPQGSTQTSFGTAF